MKLFSSKKEIKGYDLHSGIGLRRVSRDPFVDWVLILVVSLVLVVALAFVGFNAYTYNSFDLTSDGSVKSKSLNINKFNQAVKTLDDKASQSASVKKGYSGPGDPAI